MRSGYRVVLTYNLRLVGDSSTTAGAAPASVVIEAVHLLEQHFTEPAEVPSCRRDVARGAA